VTSDPSWGNTTSSASGTCLTWSSWRCSWSTSSLNWVSHSPILSSPATSVPVYYGDDSSVAWSVVYSLVFPKRASMPWPMVHAKGLCTRVLQSYYQRLKHTLSDSQNAVTFFPTMLMIVYHGVSVPRPKLEGSRDRSNTLQLWLCHSTVSSPPSGVPEESTYTTIYSSFESFNH
jgi:hypothetical protein